MFSYNELYYSHLPVYLRDEMKELDEQYLLIQLAQESEELAFIKIPNASWSRKEINQLYKFMMNPKPV